jgi:beta-lactamase regulating signal transducer with metallopeptidase domain
MSFFAGSAFLKALGWALLNSVWQFSILCFFYWLLAAGVKKLTATAKHAIALYLLFAGTVLFIISLSWKYYSYPAPAGLTGTGFVIENNNYYTVWQTAQQLMDRLMPYWSLLYLICIAVLFVKFCLFVRQANQLQRTGISKMKADWRIYVRKIAEQLGIEKEVKAVLSSRIDTPQVIGFLKPVILVPVACLTHLTTGQLEAVLLHELVHIKRNDYLVNLFVTSTEILFFFNPFVKQLVTSIRKEREYSCDDMVLQFQYQPCNYAAALLTLEKYRETAVTFGIAASGKNQKQLLVRIERLIGIKNKQQNFSPLGAYFLALLLLGFIAVVNPAKMAVDKLGAQYLINHYPKKNTGNRAYNKEANLYYFTAANTATHPLKSFLKKNNLSTDLPVLNKRKNDDGNEEKDLEPVLAGGESVTSDNIQTASQTETRDFSLPENNTAALPPDAELPATTPYVPASSFSYQFIPDTSQPKTKSETYNERVAREALIKAKKAIEVINWQKIEKELKYNKRDLAKLKLEITNELAKLNWQQINKDVQVQLNMEQLDKMQELVQQDQAIKKYQQDQVFYEALQKQLQEQDRVIKESDTQVQKTQKSLLQQQKKVQVEMKKRRIVYI